MQLVDTHAHVFLTSLPMAADRRYTPGYDARVDAYLGQLSAHDMACGVLVQPSFLGTDNRFMLAALDRFPDRLRGIAVVDAACGDGELAAMDAAGVVGIRFNMIGRDISELAGPEVASLLRRVGRLGWQVEVQARGRDIPAALRLLEAFEGPIVVDHFGLPDPALGVRDPGFRALLAEGPRGRTFVKLSAGYRCGAFDVATCAGALLAVLGPARLVWGSDWPFTQHEKTQHFAAVVNELRRWVPDLEARSIMDSTARKLFGFFGERAI